MRIILTLAHKDIRLLFRDTLGFFFTFAFPLIMSLFFGTIFSANGGKGVRDLPVLIVDEDDSDVSRSMVALLRQVPEFSLTEMARRDAALDLVRRGKQTAAIILPKGFGQLGAVFFHGRPLSPILASDPSRRAESAMINGIVVARCFQFLQGQFADRHLVQQMSQQAQQELAQSADVPLKYRIVLQPFLQSMQQMLGDLPQPATLPSTRAAAPAFELVHVQNLPVAGQRQIGNAYTTSFPQGIVWALVGCAATFGISLVTERNHGTLTRLCVAPVSRLHVLLGKAFACFITTCSVAVTLLAVAYFFFGVRPQSPLLLALGIACSAIAFVGIMMLLAVVGRTERSAAGIGWGTFLLMSMFGGGMVPLMFMPPWMVHLSPYSPVKWAILSIEGPLWRNFTFLEMFVPCTVLLAIGAAGFLLGARAFARPQPL